MSKKPCIPLHNIKLLCEEEIDVCDESNQYRFNLSKLSAIKYKNLQLNYIELNEIKIPKILHLIWFTNAYNPKEISEDNLKIIRENIEFLNETEPSWQIIIWTNNKLLIPDTVKYLSKEVSIPVVTKTIQEIDFINYDLQKKLYELIDNNFFGIASDTTRFVLLQNYGGIYCDINYKIQKPITPLLKYDFFASIVPAFEYVIEVTPVACKPGHIIVNKTVELLERNLLNIDTAPLYVQYPCSETLSKEKLETYTWTGTPLSIAFYKYAHQKENIDIVFPGGVLETYAPPSHNTTEELKAANYIQTHKQELLGIGFDLKEESWASPNNQEDL